MKLDAMTWLGSTGASRVERGVGVRAALVIISLLAAPAAWAWPNLKVVKTGPALAAPGELISYTLTYSNRGPVKSTSVVLKDFLPPNTTPLTNALNGGSLSGGTISWNLGTLSSLAGGSRTFQVRVATNVPAGSFLTNRTQIFGAEAEEPGKTNDNYSTWITRITNRPPVAQNDSYTTPEATTLVIPTPGILVNDSDPEGNSLQAILVAGVSHGLLALNTNGSFTYAPTGNYHGPDSFTYRASDGITNSGLATVSITVTPVNDAPVAVADSYTASEDMKLTIPAPGVLTNDMDADGDNLKSLFVSGPAHGTLTLNTNGGFVYLSATNFNGSDSFTYRANDGQASSGIATVHITVTPVNDAPVAVDDSYTTLEDTLLVISAPGVLGNDNDADGDVLSAALLSNPGHGSLTLNTNGSFTYLPVTNFHGPDSFTYRASDGPFNSGVATVTIRVSPVNDTPDTNQWIGHSYSVNEDTTLAVNAPGVLSGITDVDGDVLSVSLLGNPLHGMLSLNPDGSFRYTPATNYFGPDSFQFRVSDGQVFTAPLQASLTVIPVNDPPSFAKGGNQLVQQNAGPQTVPGWAADLSPGPQNESDQTVVFLVSNDRNQLFSVPPAINSGGTLTYTPAPNAYGTALVTVVARDNGGTDNGGVDSSAPRTFTLQVNAPPTVSLVSPTNGAFFFAPASFTVLADARDLDGTVTNVSFHAGTNLLGNLNSGEPYFVVLTNLPVGSYTFSATATDDLGAIGTAPPISVNVIERPPLTLLTAIYYNPQTDFFEQRVRITNPTDSLLDAVRVLVYNLTNVPPITVHNSSGFTNWVPYVQTPATVPPGSYVDMTIEFHSPLRIRPNAILRAELVPPAHPDPVVLSGKPQRINRSLMLANRTFLLEFATISNRIYAIHYSSDLVNWKAVQPAVMGDGNWVQWIDNGLPKTESAPAARAARFYRVILLP